MKWLIAEPAGGDITGRIVDVDRVKSPFPVSSYKGTVEDGERLASRGRRG
jgi:hypothetical protein